LAFVSIYFNSHELLFICRLCRLLFKATVSALRAWYVLPTVFFYEFYVCVILANKIMMMMMMMVTLKLVGALAVYSSSECGMRLNEPVTHTRPRGKTRPLLSHQTTMV